jgi:hypothetical protein
MTIAFIAVPHLKAGPRLRQNTHKYSDAAPNSAQSPRPVAMLRAKRVNAGDHQHLAFPEEVEQVLAGFERPLPVEHGSQSWSQIVSRIGCPEA